MPMNHSIDLNDPIIPGISLGGLLVRTSIGEYQEDFLRWGAIWKMEKLYSPFSAAYSVENGFIEIDVDVRNGKVYQLVAYPGYTGYLFKKLHIGMPLSDAKMIFPEMYYDPLQEGIYFRGVDGVVLNVEDDDPDPETIFEDNIHAISVFAPEAFLYENYGRW